MAKIKRTPEHYMHGDGESWAGNSKSIDINLLLQQPALFWFPADFGAWLLGFAPIQTQQHQWSPTLMLGNKAWLTVRVQVMPKMLDMVHFVQRSIAMIKSGTIILLIDQSIDRFFWVIF